MFLEHEQSNEYDRAVYFIFDDRKLIYLVTSKVACTSIKTTLGKAYSIESNNEMDIHLKDIWNGYRKVEPLPNHYDTYFKFAFVRNPFCRLVSCFRDRVEFDSNFETYFESNYKLNYKYKIRAGMTFSDFVKTIVTIPHHLADRHFKSQYATLYHNQKCKVDFVGKYESLREDWAYIANRFDFDPQLPHLNVASASRKKPYWEYYDQELLALASEYYKNDIRYFGYEENYDQLSC
ncbi:MAG: sulfotransferase family protein [Okeania sp. SIO3B5]|uniref:sulfotransferase family protein n=1 Tax=Okeania sp. SIO3B5 TaxID=2607811 RepID=UPI001400C68B|nr:sulfotransferase family protein [Okeania sp. SIO3B5]NEO54645.1 sulfotransferase family protein [Okeania sp. SIO3B5]